MQKSTNSRSREIFNNALAKYTGEYGKKAGIVITQGYLRLQSAALSATQGSFKFGVLTTEFASGASAIDPSERRLNIVDNFLVTEMRVSLLKVASGDSASISTISTFPNSITFAKSGEAANLMAIYNGALAIEIDGTKILDGWDIMRHYRAGQAQKGVLTAASGTNNAFVANQYDAASYGFFPVTPQIELKGNSKNTLTILPPVSNDMTGTSSSNYVVLELRGLLIQNGSRIAQR